MSNAEEHGTSQPIGDDKPMNYAQAAAWLGWKEYTLRQHTNAGLVPHKRVGKNVVFLPSVLRQWIADDSLASLRTQAPTITRRRRTHQ